MGLNSLDISLVNQIREKSYVSHEAGIYLEDPNLEFDFTTTLSFIFIHDFLTISTCMVLKFVGFLNPSMLTRLNRDPFHRVCGFSVPQETRKSKLDAQVLVQCVVKGLKIKTHRT